MDVVNFKTYFVLSFRLKIKNGSKRSNRFLNTLRKNRLKILLVSGGILLVPAFFAWLVNMETGMRTLFPEWKLFESVLPGFIYDSFLIFADDLSTISTLIPLLLLIYPLWMGWKILKLKAEEEAEASDGFRRKP